MLLCYCYALFSFVSLGYWSSTDNISAAFTSSQPTELKRPSRNMQWLWKNWMFLEMFVYKDFIGIFSHAQKQNNTPLTLLHHSPRWIKSFQNFLIFSDFKLILHGWWCCRHMRHRRHMLTISSKFFRPPNLL